MKKILCSIIVVLLTYVSISTMTYIKDRYYQISNGYEEYSEDDYDYLGYIFDDYNQKVNLGYADKVYDNIINDDYPEILKSEGIDEQYLP